MNPQTGHATFQYGVDPTVSGPFIYSSMNVRVTGNGDLEIDIVNRDSYGGEYSCTTFINETDQVCGTTDNFELEVVSLCKSVYFVSM